MLSQAKAHELEEWLLEQKPRLSQLRDIGLLVLGGAKVPWLVSEAGPLGLHSLNQRHVEGS